MKKFLLISLFFSFTFLYAQSAQKANRKTAERYLKLAETALTKGSVDEAGSNAAMGLAYDDTISDLYYVSAIFSKSQGSNLSVVAEICRTAFEKDTWIHDNLKSARIFYADILSDLGHYEQSMELLDSKPVIYSADSEVIRVKNFYRMGTEESFTKARQKISSARRVYKNDLRFPSLFFNFETHNLLLKRIFARAMEGDDYTADSVIPSEDVMDLADVMEADLRKNGASDAVYALYPAWFMEGEKRQRKILEYDASGLKDILWAALALEDSIIDQNTAFEYFFDFADDKIDYVQLVYFIDLLDDPEVLSKLEDHLTAFSGTLYADINNDLQYEMEVNYSRGRPQEILFDEDNDGEFNLTASCDFGEILTLANKNLGLEVLYSQFPYVESARIDTGLLSQINDALNSVDKVLYFRFAQKDAVYEPIIFETIQGLEYFENQFFIPVLSDTYSFIDSAAFVKNATFIDGENRERKYGSVTYTLLDGKIERCSFMENNIVYAECSFENGVPYQRQLDYDGDGYFETVETYLPLYSIEEKEAYDCADVITRTFPVFDFSDLVYLSAVSVDSNKDTATDFYEEYGKYGAKTTSWDNDADGIAETTFIRYEKRPDEPLCEKSIFIYGFEQDVFAVTEMDGVPVLVSENGEEYEIKKGDGDHFFWICRDFDEEKATFIMEDILTRKMERVEQGLLRMFESENGNFFVIRSGENIFARCVPEITLDDEEVEDVLNEYEASLEPEELGAENPDESF
ncbi:MAG: hypothetical protein MJ176_00420 [Treponema sp.]|nr:hypothetical protein [Treponema sp.]